MSVRLVSYNELTNSNRLHDIIEIIIDTALSQYYNSAFVVGAIYYVNVAKIG